MNTIDTQTRFDEALEMKIYFIISELLNNILKHSKANLAKLETSLENNQLSIKIKDNGKGFDVKNITAFKGAGWTNIQNRVTYLKGKIDVDSSEQNGTSVIIEIPLS